MNWIKNLFQQAYKSSREIKIQRQFAFLLLSICIIYSIYTAFTAQFSNAKGLILISIILLTLLAIIIKKTSIFQPFLLIWFLIGLLLGELISTLMLSIIYFLIFTPLSFLSRNFNKKQSNTSKWVKSSESSDYEKMY